MIGHMPFSMRWRFVTVIALARWSYVSKYCHCDNQWWKICRLMYYIIFAFITTFDVITVSNGCRWPIGLGNELSRAMVISYRLPKTEFENVKAFSSYRVYGRTDGRTDGRPDKHGKIIKEFASHSLIIITIILLGRHHHQFGWLILVYSLVFSTVAAVSKEIRL